MDDDAIIRAIQKKLNVTLDGEAWPQTLPALYTSVVCKAPPRCVTGGKVDDQSEKTIDTSQPEVVRYARMRLAQGANIQIKIIGGTRTYAQQDALFATGRTEDVDKHKVTNAREGESNHNFGIAFDIGVFDRRRYLTESSLHDRVGATGMQIGLDWGGQLDGFVAKPRYELWPDWAAKLFEAQMLAELRRRAAAGEGDLFLTVSTRGPI